LKPQSFLRQIVYAALPLGQGIVVDPFMGSGSTVAAAEVLGYSCIGVERYQEYYEMSQVAIPKLARLNTREAQMSLLPA
jgi:site-specific DNA-methyltransferase (adenine-specific)